jgi:hypothetical protein
MPDCFTPVSPEPGPCCRRRIQQIVLGDSWWSIIGEMSLNFGNFGAQKIKSVSPTG